ncbi:MAG: glycosyltransferase family 2 protein [Gemmatimonadaceae bacterium]|nr:glycosyltransferase family 2 protein [Gemmatimonadaceae bacterium]
MNLSIVSTLYLSAGHVEEFYRRVSVAADVLTPSWELILVDDGSPDASLALAIEIMRIDPRVRVIELSRNFGHHRAIMTGLAHARGALVYLTDSDLEEAPELLHRFHAEMSGTGDDVVYGVQASRKGGMLERMTGWVFYRLFNLLASSPVPANLVTSRLMTARYVRALVSHREQEMFLGGLMAITGFRQRPIIVAKSSRGETTYTLRRRVALFVNSVTSFSYVPLLAIFYLGCFIIVLASGGIVYLLVRKVAYHDLLVGWASVMITLWLLGGIMIFCMGLIGIYLSRVFSETKSRPYTIVAQVHERGE